MSEKKFLIGEVSKITGVSKDTLRFYDKINLLKPKYVSPSNNYRYYTYDQFWSIDIITCCRSLDVPLDKIRLILKSKDNQKVLELLHEQRVEAVKKACYFKRVVEDIDWYEKQQNKIQQIGVHSEVEVKYFPERKVLYGTNTEQTDAYHLKLQELLDSVTKNHHSIRRNYGFILDESMVLKNHFIKKGEYIRFDTDVFDITQIDSKYCTTLPSGNYACYVTRVVNQNAYFEPLINWLQKHNYHANYITADEIGLQLYEYLGCGYLCEVQVLLPEKEKII